MAPLPPRRPAEFGSNSNDLPDIKYGYASEIFPHMQKFISGLLGGGSSAPQGLTPQETSQNNQIWDRLGRGGSSAPRSMGPPAPMQNAQADVHRMFGFNSPGTPLNMPTQMAGGPAMGSFPQLNQNISAPQPQTAVAGLLGSPDDESRRKFLQSQLYGNMPQPPQMPTVTAGGSASPQTNPFLYAMLYGNHS